MRRIIFVAFLLLPVLFARAAGPRPAEIRAVWDHFGRGFREGEWPRTAGILAAARITDLYLNVAGPGFAHYDSKTLPVSSLFNRSGDQLAAAIAACAPHGIRVHAWVMCFSAGRASERMRDEFASLGRCLRNSDGTDSWLLDPSNPEVRAEILDAIAEIARRYPVAGIHLDYLRWRDFPSTRNTPAAMARCRAALGVDDPGDRAIFDWRARTIGSFAAEARRIVKSLRPGATISAAVYGKYPSCVDAVGQDWHAWLESGIVDYAVPMDYTADSAKFAEWTGEQSRTRFLADRVVAGIGVTAAESRLDADKVNAQVKRTREAGLAGFALFDLDEVLEREILPLLDGRAAPGR